MNIHSVIIPTHVPSVEEPQRGVSKPRNVTRDHAVTVVSTGSTDGPSSQPTALTNFRDLGGLPTACGRTVKHRSLLRAGELTDLTDADVSVLRDDFGLSLVIDLRSGAEAQARPNVNIAGVSSKHFDVMADQIQAAADPQEYLRHLVNAETAAQMLCGMYQNLAISSIARDGYAAMIRSMLRNAERGATLFHCAAGKDRTGLGAAIVLRILGVSTEHIMADYLETINGRAEANAQLIAEHRAKGMPENVVEALATMFSVKPEYLQAAFRAIEQKYGTFEKYIESGLAITGDECEQLRLLFLVP